MPTATAYHEAGHAVVGRIMGARIMMISVYPGLTRPADAPRGALGHVTPDYSCLPEDKQDEAAATLALAGHVAQLIVYGLPVRLLESSEALSVACAERARQARYFAALERATKELRTSIDNTGTSQRIDIPPELDPPGWRAGADYFSERWPAQDVLLAFDAAGRIADRAETDPMMRAVIQASQFDAAQYRASKLVRNHLDVITALASHVEACGGVMDEREILCYLKTRGI